MDDITYFAEANFRDKRTRFGIKRQDRRKHVYVIGKTGMGKTTILENMAIQDIQSGEGIGFMDPHGDTAEKLLDYIPEERIDDVIYFNPADIQFPIAFNAIENVDPDKRHLMASGLVGVFHKLWAETWGPRLEHVLRNTIMALLEVPDSTLLGIMRMLVDKQFRKKIVEQLKDPVVKSFWTEEFAKYSDKFQTEAVAPIQNKVGQFLTSSLIRNIVGQTHSAIDIRKAMDEGKIVIMNLSKGRIGEDNSALFGAMLITKIQLAAMSRVDTPEEERKDFFLYVDEFQNFSTESFANILSEARKYRLNLTLAHQYITQVQEEVRDAVFGNVGTMITCRVGGADAEFLEKEFSPEFMLNDIVNLGFASIYLKLMIDGIASRPFSAATLPPIPKPEVSYRDEIIKRSRERYGTAREEVEQKIIEWSRPIEASVSGAGFSAEAGEGMPARAGAPMAPQRPLYDAHCFVCGQKTQVVFVPDPNRPVYCKEHLNLINPVRSKTPQASADAFAYRTSNGVKEKGAPPMPAHAAGPVSQRPEPQAMAGMPAHAGGPPPAAPRQSFPQRVSPPSRVPERAPARANGGPAISNRSSEERISLNEAFKKPPVLFRPEKKEHRKVNVDELKKIIDETVNEKEEE